VLNAAISVEVKEATAVVDRAATSVVVRLLISKAASERRHRGRWPRQGESYRECLKAG
jgi:hypothetical protein